MPQRVLIVNHTGIMGGAEVGLAEWIRFLDRDRVYPLVAAPMQGPLNDRLRAAGDRVLAQPMIRVQRTWNPCRMTVMAVQGWRQISMLSRLAGQERVRVLHANSNHAHLITAPAARRMGMPCIWHVRDLTPLGWIGRRLYRRASLIVAVSKSVERHVQQYRTGHDRVRVITNGIDVTRFNGDNPDRAAARRSLFPRIDDTMVLIGMVGNLVPWKRHDLFLDIAANMLRENADQLRFVIVGDDRFGDHPEYERSLICRITKSPLNGRVLLAGYREDIPRVMQALDILVHPAEREPFGRVMVEAMAADRPVVAVNAGGASEIVVDRVTGYLTAPNDVGAMTNAVRSLARNPALRRQLGEAGRQRALREFDVRRVGRLMTEMYEELANEYASDRH